MDVLIIGAGGHGRVVLDILREAGAHRAVGFVDADPALHDATVVDLPVLGAPNVLSKLRGKARGAIVAIGDNRARLQYARLVIESGLELVSAVHPRAIVSRTAQLGANVVIAAGAVVGTDVVLGSSTIVNSAAVVEHECEIAQAVHVCPGAKLAGRVRVGTAAFVGLGACVIQCLSVGPHATVGAGAVVLSDVPAGATVVGVPARVIRATAASSDG